MENKEEKCCCKKEGEKSLQKICITDNEEVSPAPDEAHAGTLCEKTDNKTDKKAQKCGIGNGGQKSHFILALLFSSIVARYIPTIRNTMDIIAPVSP